MGYNVRVTCAMATNVCMAQLSMDGLMMSDGLYDGFDRHLFNRNWCVHATHTAPPHTFGSVTSYPIVTIRRVVPIRMEMKRKYIGN